MKFVKLTVVSANTGDDKVLLVNPHNVLGLLSGTGKRTKVILAPGVEYDVYGEPEKVALELELHV